MIIVAIETYCFVIIFFHCQAFLTIVNAFLVPNCYKWHLWLFFLVFRVEDFLRIDYDSCSIRQVLELVLLQVLRFKFAQLINKFVESLWHMDWDW